jgi:hypothetical protein
VYLPNNFFHLDWFSDKWQAYEGQQINTLASRIAITSLALGSESGRDAKMVQRTPSTSHTPIGIGKAQTPLQRLGPEEYKNAKKTLKKAVLEFYRCVLVCILDPKQPLIERLEASSVSRITGYVEKWCVGMMLIWAKILNVTGFRKALKKFEKVTEVGDYEFDLFMNLRNPRFEYCSCITMKG